MSGETFLWEAQLVSPEHDEALVQQFIAQAEAAYNEILSAVAQPEADLAALSRQYQQVKASDYFNSAIGQRVREMLMTAKGEVEP